MFKLIRHLINFTITLHPRNSEIFSLSAIRYYNITLTDFITGLPEQLSILWDSTKE